MENIVLKMNCAVIGDCCSFVLLVVCDTRHVHDVFWSDVP